jgi:glucose/arabinose dehydrogenase
MLTWKQIFNSYALLLGLSVVSTTALAIAPSDLTLTQVVPNGSFNHPIGIRAPNDGSGRLFVIDRCVSEGSPNTTSSIKIVKNGAVVATPFLTIPNVACVNEQGLLGLAFDPNYATNGTFYVVNTASGAKIGATEDQVLTRYTVSANADVANATGTVVMRVPDIASNHNGGDIHFGLDGFLYWSMGDGGVQGDPNGFAQCTGRKSADNTPSTCHTPGSGVIYYLLGKIIRLDVHATTASAAANMCASTPGQPAQYSIPPGNPFASMATFPNDCAEIFNWGFRNPFRFSFDRLNGDMYIGDVGQNKYEEIDYQPAASVGQNFQWNACEGLHTYPGGAAGCNPAFGGVPPKIEYPHGGTCAVVGGYLYRGPIQQLRGQYIFSDYCSSAIYISANPAPASAAWSYVTLGSTPFTSGTVYGFGEGADGNLYVADDGHGTIWRFTSDFIFQDGFESH